MASTSARHRANVSCHFGTCASRLHREDLLLVWLSRLLWLLRLRALLELLLV